MERKPEQNSEAEKEQLTYFRKEMQRIKNEEMAKKAEGRFDYNPAFETMGDTGYLGKREYDVYTLVKERKISREEFIQAKEKTFAELQTIKAFWLYMGNQMQEVMLEKLREERQNEAPKE